MHISSPVNAIEDFYVTLGHFVKIKVASKMADSRFIVEMPYFSRFALLFCIFESSDLHLSEKMVDLCTNLSLFNSLIRKGGVQDGGD